MAIQLIDPNATIEIRIDGTVFSFRQATYRDYLTFAAATVEASADTNKSSTAKALCALDANDAIMSDLFISVINDDGLIFSAATGPEFVENVVHRMTPTDCVELTKQFFERQFGGSGAEAGN